MNLMEIIIIGIFAAILMFGVNTCNNSMVDAEMNKVDSSAYSLYKQNNTESWSQNIVGGDAMKKTVFLTYYQIAKENDCSVYEAVRGTRSRFAGQFKQKFKSLSNFINLPTVTNAFMSKTLDGKDAIVVSYTYRDCDNEHCWNNTDQVIIPEIEREEIEIEFENEPVVNEPVSVEVNMQFGEVNVN